MDAVKFARISSEIEFNQNIDTKYSDYKTNTIIFIEDTKNIFFNGQYYNNLSDIPETIIELGYDELYRLYLNEELIPGLKYQITYYATSSDPETEVNDFCFNIILTAVSRMKFNENVIAVYKPSFKNKYYANYNLNAWKIKYCIENDPKRFGWADENGYGVIYYMKDEHDNEAPYDFKNIRFKRYYSNTFEKYLYDINMRDYGGINDIFDKDIDLSDYLLMYTFNTIDNKDASFEYFAKLEQISYKGRVGNNVIKPYFLLEIHDNISYNVLQLNHIVFIYSNDLKGNYALNQLNGNYVGPNCKNMTISESGNYIQLDNINIIALEHFNYNKIGSGCSSLLFKEKCSYNRIGSGCIYILFGEYCNDNRRIMQIHNI